MATSTTTSTTTAVTTKDMKSKQLYLSMPRIPPKVYLETVNPHITCNLCKGYLIDATTIVECLHSFCRSCILIYLKRNIGSEPPCPCCEVSINSKKPNIKSDATLQAIVYKLVPGLYEKELLRRRAFYKLRTKEALETTPEQRGDETELLIFGPNENISLMLEYSDNENSHHISDDEVSNSSHEINSSDHCDDDFEVQLRKPKYLQCPAIFTISNLKKFLLHKFSINPNKFRVEIMYKVRSLALPDHYKLMDVAYIFTWKRDAPMKFLYCVRAASSPVANIEQSAVMYDLPPKRFQTSSQLACASDSTDQEHDQSSDADSETRSERTKEPEVNGTDAQISQEEPINSTSDEPKSAPSSSSTLPSMTKATSSATVTSTSVASTSSTTKSKSDSSSHASVNGSENQKKDNSDKVVNESVSSPTTSRRLENSTTIKTERFSASPEKQHSDRRSNGASPKPNTPKSRSTPDNIQPSSSPSRTNQDLKDSKEKVKTKSIMLDGSASKSSDSTQNRSEPKTVTFADKPSPSRIANDTTATTTKSTPTNDRSKGRLLFNKDEKAKSLSPPLSAENEYDFDQHLLKEKLSEKKKFLSSIDLTPRIPSTDSPLVQLPKMPKTEQKSETTLPTNLSKDKDANSKTPTTNSTTALSSSRPSVSSSSSSSNADKQTAVGIKKPENKTSKRKSREPVKNVAKIKCVSPNERIFDMKWDPMKSIVVSSGAGSSSMSTPTTSHSSSSSNSNADRLRKAQESTAAAMARMLGVMSQQNKNQLKSIASSASSSTNKSNQSSSSSTPTTSNASKSVFKTPTSSSSKESSSQSTGLKQQSQASTSESETSIIINNVQRPNQADTPRPTMSFKPNLNQPQSFYFSPNLNRSFLNETEIQEIRNDDARKLKVYGPPMSLTKPLDSPIPGLSGPIAPDLFNIPQLLHQFGKQPQLNLNFPLSTLSQLPLNQLVALQQYQNYPNLQNLQNLQMFEALKMNKPKKSSLDSKKSSSSNNFDGKSNALSKSLHPIRANESVDPNKQQNVQPLLPCKIPASLSITLTNDDGEMPSRPMFNAINNSIEIVKLSGESGNDTNAKFPSPSSSSSSSSSVEKVWQAANKNANNQIKLLANQQNNQIDSTSSKPQSDKLNKTYQEKFLQSLKTSMGDIETLKSLKQQRLSQQLQPIRPNLSPIDLARKREAQKRRQQQDEKAAKVRKLQLPSASQQQQQQQPPKSSPTTQRPVPDLLNPKDDKKVSMSNSSSSTTAQTSTSQRTNAVVNNSKSNAEDRQSPTVSSNVSSSDKATTNVTVAVTQAKVQSTANEIPTSKYLPLQTSSMPIWANHCTADQMASHKALVENLTQNKKNSGTFVD